MPAWFVPALAAGAYTLIARKLISRYWHGRKAQHAVADPPGLRTVARFESEVPAAVLRAIAGELAHDLEDVEVTKDALRTRDADAAQVDIVRFARRDDHTSTVELTRAWTGVHLGDQTRHLLGRIHAALVAHARNVAWFARQDRAFETAHATPFDPQPAAR